MTNPISRRKNRNSNTGIENTTETEMVDVSGVSMEIQEESSMDETVVIEETPQNRIPSVLADNTILADFCQRYLDVLDKISAYNAEVLAEKDKEWPSSKVLEKAKEFANPTDANVAPKEEIKAAHAEWERLVTEVNRAKRYVLEVTAKELGITLNVSAERDPEAEKPLKEARNLATEIGKQLSMIAKMTTDKGATDAVTSFLASNPLPAIGRNQASTFGGSEEKATPKYRVDVKVYDKDGNVIVEKPGFTQSALALTKHYPRGEGMKSDKLRAIWEAAGNTSENTIVDPVEFDDNDLHFVISKRK